MPSFTYGCAFVVPYSRSTFVSFSVNSITGDVPSSPRVDLLRRRPDRLGASRDKRAGSAARAVRAVPAGRRYGDGRCPGCASDAVIIRDLQSMERTMIEQALEAARFNKSKAAKALGLTRHQLYIRMRKHGFE
jgi:hypothetical protein